MTDPTLQLLVLCGSLRKASFNRMVAQTLPELAPASLKLRFAPSLADIALYDQDVNDAGIPAPVAALGAAVSAADGLVIVTPEYNYSVPGVLKNTLDWLSRVPGKPMAGKPVALQSASMGLFGGARAQYHLRQVLVCLDARVLNMPEVMVGQVQHKVDAAAGRVTDEGTRKVMAAQLGAFAAFIAR